MCSLITGNIWPRVISNHRKFVCSSKSVMLARLLLREHFQILGSYFLPHTNTVILLDSYCGIIKETGLFSPGFENYLESVRVTIGVPVCGRTVVCLVGVRSSDYKMFLEWVDLLTHGALHAPPRAPLKLKLII